MKGSLFKIITFIGVRAFQEEKRRNCRCSEKRHSRNHVDLPPLLKKEATRVCIWIANSEMLLATVCKSPCHVWNDADIIEFLSFRHTSLIARGLNAKYLFWNSVVSNTSGAKILNLLHNNEFDISAPQCPTHYSPAGNADVLDIIVHKNVRLSEVTVSDIMESDHLPITF
jgi:hypothetical protein